MSILDFSCFWKRCVPSPAPPVSPPHTTRRSSRRRAVLRLCAVPCPNLSFLPFSLDVACESRIERCVRMNLHAKVCLLIAVHARAIGVSMRACVIVLLCAACERASARVCMLTAVRQPASAC
eukprot:6183179-Pleurochrysis_carterae.AAC.1